MSRPLVLAIETSCDETAAAVLRFPGELRGQVIASQAEVHATYGGVVPEVASRNHLAHLREVVESALTQAGVGLGDIGLFAATTGPGLASATASEETSLPIRRVLRSRATMKMVEARATRA